MPFAAAIGAVGSIAGAVISSSASSNAAGQAADASTYAAQLAQQRYEETRADLQPYNQMGQAALGTIPNIINKTNEDLNNAYNLQRGAYDKAQSFIPGKMTEDQLINTPGYQFNLAQGLKAVQSSAAAKGLGISSPAMQAAAKYATGLADSTYQNQFANAQTIYGDYNNQFGNAGTLFNARNSIDNTLYNQNSNLAGLGEAAASQTGNYGAQLANTQATAIQGAGNALAAGTLGSANALSGGINGAANSLSKYLMQQPSTTNASGYSGGGYYGGIDGSAGSNYGTQTQGANELQQMGFYTPLE